MERHGLKVFAISNHLTGQAVCDDPIDERHRAIVRERVWGDGDAEGVRERAAEEMKLTARLARKLGVDTVVGFTGSSIWQYVAMFPPVPADRIAAGYETSPDDGTRSSTSSTSTVSGSPTRCTPQRSPTTTGRRPAPSRRSVTGRRSDSTGTEPHDVAGPRSGRLHHRLRRSDLPRRLQGHPDADGRRPQRHPLLTPSLGDPHRGWDFVSTGRGDVPGRTASGPSPPSGTTDRSPSSGRTPAWTACTAPPRHWTSSAASTSSHLRLPSTPHSRAIGRPRPIEPVLGAPVCDPVRLQTTGG